MVLGAAGQLNIKIKFLFSIDAELSFGQVPHFLAADECSLLSFPSNLHFFQKKNIFPARPDTSFGDTL